MSDDHDKRRLMPSGQGLPDVWSEVPHDTLDRGRTVLITVAATLLAFVFGLALPYFGYQLNWAPHRLFKIVAGSVITALIVFRPTATPHLLCFALPFVAWLPKSPLSMLNTMNLLTIGSLLSVGNLALQRRVRPIIPTSLNLPILIFCMLLVSSAIFGRYFYGSYFYSDTGAADAEALREVWKVVNAFLIFYVIVHLIPDRRTLWRVLVSLILAGTVGVLGPVYEAIQTRFGSRTGGGLGEINQMAAFLAIGSIFAFSMIPAYRSVRKLAVAMSSATQAFCMFLPNSRGAYVGFLVAALPQAFRTSIAGTLLLLAMVGSSAFFAPDYVKERVLVTWNVAGAEDPADALDETSGGRLTIWKAILPVIAAHPVFGVGYGNLGAAMHPSLGTYRSGHSLFLEVAGEMGIPALLVLLWIFFAGWRVASKLVRRGGRSTVLGRSYHGVVICLLVVNVFGQRFLSFSLAGFFFVLSGLIVLEERFTSPKADEVTSQ